MVRHHLETPTRRQFLDRACRCGLGLATLSLLSSCGAEEEPPGPRLAWSELPDGGRVVLLDGSLPIEVSREGDQLLARSLLCTHQGCQVKWKPEERQYHCPCHEGVFDESGRPVMGPPPSPLREFPVERRGDYVQLDTRAPGEVE